MAHNLNNIVVDRVLRGVFSDKNDNIIFSLNQVQDLSMNQTSESMEVKDALGVSILELMRSKALEVSANNAIYDFSLLAAQYGTAKVEASADVKVLTPMMETVEVVANKTEYNLKHTPKNAPVAIYAMNGDSTLGAKYAKGTSASATEFAIEGAKITVPTGLAAGTELFVMYEYEAENAIEIVNSAKNFAKLGKMTFEILAYDVCDPETKLFGYLIMPRFQLSNDFDWSIGGDSQQHAFSGKAMVDYCDKEKTMVKVVVVDDEE